MSTIMKLKDINIAVVDTETTGLSPQTNEIIEIAAIIYDPNEDKIIREWEAKAAPRNIKTASEYALKINGYNEDPNSYTGNIKDIIAEYCNIVSGCTILGQNIKFDMWFINKYLDEFGINQKQHRHRTLELSSITWPIMRKTGSKNTSLASQCEHFGVSNVGAHRALADCRRTLEVYRCAMMTYNTKINLR